MTARGGSGPSISGGGTIAVDTSAMTAAAHGLRVAADVLQEARSGAAWCRPARPEARARLDDAVALLGRAVADAERAEAGLRIAADRYGTVEHAVLDGQRMLAAGAAALTGGVLRTVFFTAGPGAAVLLGAGLVDVALVAGAARTVQHSLETGRLAPQSDPVLLRSLALVIASLDDGLRGAMLLERPDHVLTDDPGAPIGSEGVAAVLAALLLHPAGADLRLERTRRGAVTSPRSLAELADRLPDGGEPAGQVRIERYDGADGTRWIVYIAGTVTFERDSGEEPFDLASDVLGVAHRPSDSERAVLAAMAEAGVDPDEPVLLVGHSQGALDAVRVAEDGGYRVGGVVGFGGPTGQIPLPEEVPVLAVEHDEDLVPVLGGTAASGAAGLRRLVVRRSLPDEGYGPATSPATARFPAHDLGAYRRTTAAAEATGDARVEAFKGRIGPFLDGDRGTATRWRARRVLPVRPGPARTAVGGSGPRPSR